MTLDTPILHFPSESGMSPSFYASTGNNSLQHLIYFCVVLARLLVVGWRWDSWNAQALHPGNRKGILLDL